MITVIIYTEDTIQKAEQLLNKMIEGYEAIEVGVANIFRQKTETMVELNNHDIIYMLRDNVMQNRRGMRYNFAYIYHDLDDDFIYNYIYPKIIFRPLGGVIKW